MKITKRRKVLTTIMYVMAYCIMLAPLYEVENKKCNLIQLAVKIFHINVAEIADLYGMNSLTLQVSFYVQSVSVLLFFTFSIIYILLVYRGKNIKINCLNLFWLFVFMAFQMLESLDMFFGASKLSSFVSFLLIIIVGLEILVSLFADRWDELVAEAKRFEEKEKAEKIEKEERLKFEGKRNRLFYYIVWKNFKSNWKDYSLILVSNIILVMITVVAFCMRELLSGKYEIKRMQIFNGISEILINAMIPIIILAVFTIIILFYYYIKCRARNFGVFLTLGMRRNTLYAITAVEFVSVFLLSLLMGIGLGRVIAALITKGLNENFQVDITIADLGAKPYVLSVLVILAIYIVAVMTAKDIFVDFNVGKSIDLRAVAEKRPGKKGIAGLSLGIILCVFSVFQYSRLYRFENEYLLLVFFIGMLLIIRYGMAIWLLWERKKSSYLKKLMIHNQLFHKSKTNAGFIGIMAIAQFCVLFYFSFQMMGTLIAEDIETLFPYDYVCYADESDDSFFEELQDEYQIEVFEYPMVRVSAYDSTEMMENQMQGQKPIQGQHIGISESTYHALKKQQNPEYIETDLDLDENGKNIHIVYQQDKSVKAQPTAFYSPIKKPLLHIGQPCRDVYIWDVNKKDIGYYFYEVKSEEIGVLTGDFRQGVRENIIVFSDEYFEKAKDFWKTTDIDMGIQIENEEDRILDVNITQGVTKIILINAMSDVDKIGEELEVFEQKHLDKETDLYYGFMSAGVYDLSIAYHYGKREAMESIELERAMKLVMNVAAIVLFFAMNVMILIVKMLSERELNVKRAEFLTCMGMYRKSRMKLIRAEILRYYVWFPFAVATGSSIIYTYALFIARKYTETDIMKYFRYYVPMFIAYTVLHCTISYLITTIYAHRVEGLRYGRNS